MDDQGAQNKSAIIPFGKYKGQPVEVLDGDPQYKDWLCSQAWFREKRGDLYTLIINNFGEAADTPEHNKIQALFLETDFRERLVCLLSGLNPNSVFKWADKQRLNSMESILKRFRSRNIDGNQAYGRDKKFKRWELKEEIASHKTCFENLNDLRFVEIRTYVNFELEKGADIRLGYDFIVKQEIFDFQYFRGHCPWHLGWNIEIKTSVGDDIPSVLRQMKRQQANVLLLGNYNGVGMTKEQMVKFFRNENCRVVFLDEIHQPKFSLV